MNDKPFTKHWCSALLLLLALLLDGSLMQTLGQFLLRGPYVALPELLTLMFVLLALFLRRETWLIPLAILFGLLADSYYSGILGVNVFMLPLLVYLMLLARDYLPATWPFALGLFIIALMAQSMLDYTIATLMGVTTMSISTFIVQHVAPTFNLNVILFAISYYPCTRLLVKLESE